MICFGMNLSNPRRLLDPEFQVLEIKARTKEVEWDGG